MALTRPRYHQLQEVDFKNSCRAVTTSNVTLSGGTPTSVDGVTLAANDRVLVTAQSTASQNGVYRVATLGSGSNGTWSRAPDFDSASEVSSGIQTIVTEGTTYNDTQWLLTTNDPITIGTTSLTFTHQATGKWSASGSNIYYSTGNVGIGSSTANASLHLTSGTDQKLILSGSGSPNINLNSSTGDDFLLQDHAGLFRVYNSTDSRQDFSIDGSGDAAFTNDLTVGGAAEFAGGIGVLGATPSTSAGSIGIKLPNEKYLAWYDDSGESGTAAYARGVGGALHFGGSSYVFNADVEADFNGNVKLSHDGAVLYFGTDSEVTLTHVHNTGMLLNSTMQLQFGDSGTYIHQSADGVLDLVSDTELELNATTIDINGNVEISGTAAITGVATFSATPVFPDGSIAVADLDIDGATDIGAAIVDADLFIVDDGAGGANRKVTASRLKTYAGGASEVNDLSDGVTNSSGGTLGIGTGALAADDGSANNGTAFGKDALNDQTTGFHNVAMGYQAGDKITTGGGHVAIGSGSMGAVTTTHSSVAIGYRAMEAPTGVGNTFVGAGAGEGGGGAAYYNVGVGYSALEKITTGEYNSAVGMQAGLAVTSGRYNTFLGHAAGDATTDSDNVIVIGYNADASAVGVDNEITFGNSSITAVRFPQDGTAFKFGADGEVVLTHVADTGIRLSDSDKMMFGDGNDLQLYHDGSNSYIDDAGTGSLYLRSNELQVHKYTGEVMATFTADGAVTLYHNNSAKLATSSTGVIVTGVMTGTATAAQYADLAEKYVPDAEYPVGTVMTVGGGAEIKYCDTNDIPAGVISDKPAYLMNSEQEHGVPIALVGRVPVRVVGVVEKGQLVKATLSGVASVFGDGERVGIALESNDDSGEKLVECLLKV